MPNEETMINFLDELNHEKKIKEAENEMKESNANKLRIIKDKKDEARGVCLKKLVGKIYKDAVPMSDEQKDLPYNDLESEMAEFLQKKSPKGIECYFKESIKKGSEPAKILLEKVEELLHEHFYFYEYHLDDVKADEIDFDIEDPEIDKKIEDISYSMQFDELSDAIENNVKVATNAEIKRVKDEAQTVKDLQDSLSEDETVTTESVAEKELLLRGYNKTKGEFYQPTLFEGIMINKLNLFKESDIDLTDEEKNKLAFVESVKEYTKISVLKALKLGDTKKSDMKRLANSYATMQESVSIPLLDDNNIEYYHLYQEGANLDSREIFKEYKVQFKKDVKEVKKYIKEKETKKAETLLKKMKKDIHKTYDDIEKQASTIGSAVFGVFTANYPFLLRYLLTALLSIPTLNIAAFANSIAMIAERVNTFLKDFEKRGFDAKEDLNLYKNALKTCLNEFDFLVDSMINKVKKLNELEKKSEKK